MEASLRNDRNVLSCLHLKEWKWYSRNLFHFQDDDENDIMNEKSGGIDAPNIDGLKKNMGGGGGKINSVFAASLRELSQPNYYRYIFMFKICRMSNLLLIGTRDTSCCEILNLDSYSQICFTGIVWLPVASSCRQSLLP